MTLDEMAPTAAIQPVEPGYRHVLRLSAALFWLPLFIGSLVVNYLALRDTPVFGLPPLIVGLVAFSAISFAPDRIYRRLGYSVDAGLLRVVRGWLFHTDTIVPFVRVQHIDVKRGPLDKMFGIATLVVHTAGTHNSIVSLPGLAPDTAATIRDDIRSLIRSDL
ncbi:MAG: PH domain-containing protein [Sphingomicrobium sp.]